MRRTANRPSFLAIFVLLAGSGCIWMEEDPSKLDLGVDPVFGPLAKSAAYRDTIGACTYYDGLRPMRVRGYGLVVGLGKNGSRECPRVAHDRLVESLYKQHRFSSAVVGSASISPEQLIRDIDTAVVIVQGEIPPAAVKGGRFDIAVGVLPGTQTKSLRGGRLFTTDLHIYRSISNSVAITGRILARAAGPVFLNPFSEKDAPTRTSSLEGIVVGGGEVRVDRRIRLVLTEASYQRVQRIQDRINARFPGRRAVADAISPSFIRLRIPREYHDDAAHFLALVRSLYLSHDPRFEATRARMLAQEILSPTAPHAQIALAMEGVGRAVLPILPDLYLHPKPHVSFHAAAAGLRLGDHLAADAMIMHSNDASGSFRFQAIRALARAEGMAGATIALRRLLYDGDPRVRIAAYEALVSRGDSAVKTVRVGGDNFLLDLIPWEGDNFVYVKRKGARRIALFGREFRCRPPVLYRAPDGSVTIHAADGDNALTILRTVVSTGAMSKPISAALDLPDLIELMGSEAGIDLSGEVVGLGLDYAAVARVLHRFCKDGTIGAEFVLEQPNAAELFGTPKTTGRPESER